MESPFGSPRGFKTSPELVNRESPPGQGIAYRDETDSHAVSMGRVVGVTATFDASDPVISNAVTLDWLPERVGAWMRSAAVCHQQSGPGVTNQVDPVLDPGEWQRE